MEAELLPVAEVSLGMVTSSLLPAEPRDGSEENDSPGGGSETMVAMCPSGRLISFVTSTYKAQFVFLEESPLYRAGLDGEDVASYRNSFEGLLDVPRDPESPKPRPKATAMVILPIVFETEPGSVQRSSVVMVGFSDGYIRGYSKSGQRVFSRLLHLEPINKLTCMASSTVHKPVSSASNLVVLYRSSTLCVIEGWSIVEVIKVNVAKIKSSVGGDMGGVRRESIPEGGAEDLLKYKKWSIKDQTLTNDVALLAHVTPSSFDHLSEASMVAGFDAAIRSTPVPEAKLITVGENPMIVLYKITKDAGHINVSEVMQVMASKMTSAVLGRLSKAGGWLGWGGGSAQKVKPPEEKIEISTKLPMSTNIPDNRRSVLSVTVSPLGNLAALVDGFGRVLLLDCETLIIRRMWKGYRAAQCGWALVYDSPASDNERKKSSKSSKRRGSGSSGSGGDGPSCDVEGLRARKKAQCLCIYAPRRGILELWPVQSGSRVAAIPIGKGCHLLYAPHGPFTAISPLSPSSPSEAGGRLSQGDVLAGEKERLPRVRDTVLVLSPDGKISTVAIPFPSLVRLSDPTSFDTHLMTKLAPAIQSGDSDMMVQVVQCVKSTQSLKKAVDVIIEAYPHPNISLQFLIELLTSALSRITADPALSALHQYISGVKQLVEFVSGVQSLPLVESSRHFTADKLKQRLTESCGVSTHLAMATADILSNYFTTFAPQRRVVKEMSLKSIVKCFKLPSKIGNVLIRSSSLSSGCHDDSATPSGIERSVIEALSEDGNGLPPDVVEMDLREGLSGSVLLDLGCTLLSPLLVKTSSHSNINSLFSKTGIRPATTLCLLSQALLNGNLSEGNPCSLLQRLDAILSAVLRPPDLLLTSAQLRNDLLRQCSRTPRAGHALLLALLAQRYVGSGTQEGETREVEEAMDMGEGQWEELEAWETVSAEKEQWIRLIHHLEGLTLLSNAIGQANMQKLPPAPWTDSQQRLSAWNEQMEGEESYGEPGSETLLDVGKLKIMLLSDVLSGGVTASSLEDYGPGLIAHCVASWLAKNSIPADFVAQMPSDPHDLPDGEHSKVVYLFAPLLSLLPRSLSHQSLLVHTAWQAAMAKRHQLSLEFVSKLGDIRYMSGTIGLLWHHVYESETVRIIDAIRKGAAVESTDGGIIAVSRNLFAYLHELCLHGDAGDHLEASTHQDTLRDVLIISRKLGKLSLLEMVAMFPRLSPTVSRTYFELLLLMELVLHLNRPINVVSFFPTWLRSALKKGAYKSAWQDQVPVQLQQKRTKFLCECVRGVLREPAAAKVSAILTSDALKELRTSRPSLALSHLELAELDDHVFLLVDLWQLDADSVRMHWISSLFAAGKEAHGKKIFLAVDDKTKVSRELLSLAGFLCDHMIKTTENKTHELAMLAQTPPTLLQWLKKQSSTSAAKTCDRVDPTWQSLSQLVHLIQPYLTDTPNASSICKELETLVNFSQKLNV